MAVNGFVPKKSFWKRVHHALPTAYDSSQLASLFDNSFNNSFLEMGFRSDCNKCAPFLVDKNQVRQHFPRPYLCVNLWKPEV